MKLTQIILSAAAVALTLAGNANAQFFLTPSTPVVNDYSVNTQGTEVWGASGGGQYFNFTPYTLANGVKFEVFNNSNFVSYPGSSVQVDQDGEAYANEAASSIPALGLATLP